MTIIAELYPLIIYTVLTVIIISGLLLAARFLGSGGSSANKNLPYESGVIPFGAARRPLSVPFYLLAIFFIVFDVESAFIFTWAVAVFERGGAGDLIADYKGGGSCSLLQLRCWRWRCSPLHG
jgi:NADH-quinone oxidoreductase subunit A